MTEYSKMYSILFNAITDALEAMDGESYELAAQTLMTAQQSAEELYVGG